jgi:hypothetical protein
MVASNSCFCLSSAKPSLGLDLPAKYSCVNDFATISQLPQLWKGGVGFSARKYDISRTIERLLLDKCRRKV